MKNILLVDDHVVIRSGLRSLLQEYNSHIRILEAHNDNEAMKILRQHPIDLVVMDLQIPNADVVSFIELISIKYPHIYILVFSILPERIYAKRVLKAGASGYLQKDADVQELKRAFELALNNKRYISQNLLDILSADILQNRTSNPFEILSHREFEIVNMLIAGKNISSIAKELNIKPSTVGTYKTRIYQKLTISNLFELKDLASLYSSNRLDKVK